MNIVYFDLETRRTANDVGGWDKKGDMGISVAVTFSTARRDYAIYLQDEAAELAEELVRADLVVGYNILHFDYDVLMAHTPHDLHYNTRSLDMLAEIEKATGGRPGLDAMAKTNLGIGKTAEGLDAIRWYREGRFGEIARYCCHDVKTTRLLHEHGAREGQLIVPDRNGNTQHIDVDWKLA